MIHSDVGNSDDRIKDFQELKDNLTQRIALQISLFIKFCSILSWGAAR
jgi:hypothetical protein